MKVLQVIPAIAERYGGPSDAVVALVRELIRRGQNCLVATTDADGTGRLPVRCHETTEWRGIPVRFFPRLVSESFKYSSTLAKWLDGHVKDFDLVHIHAIFSHASLAASRACSVNAIPYVLRPLGSLDPETMNSKWLKKRLYWQFFGRGMARRAAGVHYSTPREQRVVERSLGIGRGFVVPPGIEPGRRSPCCPSARETQKSDRPYVLVLARLEPIKRIELLMDAFLKASAPSRLSRWRLLIAGDGSPGYVTQLRTRARAAGAGERIEFVGWVAGERRDALLREADLFALTSRHENFGRSVAEALGCGVPAVVTRDIYLCDAIEANDAGWVVADTQRDVARALREAMSDDGLRRAKGERATRLAHGSLGIASSVDLLLAHYERFIAGATGPVAIRPGPSGDASATASGTGPAV